MAKVGKLFTFANFLDSGFFSASINIKGMSEKDAANTFAKRVLGSIDQ